MKPHFIRIGCLTAFLTLSAFAQNRYALVLEDEPVAVRVTTRAELQSVAANIYRQRVETAQRGVRDELVNRNIAITGSVSTLLNAVFVTAAPDRLAELKSIPGVLDVVPVRRHRALLSRATALMNGPQAWNLTPGGAANAGAGVKIAILDTGVDQINPVFQDPSFPAHAGRLPQRRPRLHQQQSHCGPQLH